MRIIRRCLLALAAIWSITIGMIFAIQLAQPTPQKFMAYVAEHPLEGLNASKRAAIIGRAARLLNRLSFEQRQQLKESGTIRKFFVQLTSEERRRFLRLTLPEGFRQLIAALNRMDPVERKRLVQRTLRNVRKHSSEAGELADGDEITGMISEGLAIFNEDADPQVKLDFAPVIEELRRKQEATKASAALPGG